MTIWSQQALQGLIAAKNPDALTQVQQDWSRLRLERSRYNGNWYLKCGFNIVLEFMFPSFRVFVDAPQWETQLDQATQQFKFKLYVSNAENLTYDEFSHIEGFPPPDDLQQRPGEYNPAWQLGWQYRQESEGNMIRNIIQIFRVEDGARVVIHTLRPGLFIGDNAEEWFRKKLPIVLHKHKTYLEICPSLWLARVHDVRKSYGREKMSDPKPDFSSYTMTADETAWVSNDHAITLAWLHHQEKVAQRALERTKKHQQEAAEREVKRIKNNGGAAAVGGAGLQAMLATLQQLAE